MSFESLTAAVCSGISGAGLFGYGFYLRNKLSSCQRWPQAAGTVAESGVNTDDGYEAKVIYEYTANGAGYTGSRLRFGAATSYLRKSSAEAAASRFPAGSRVTVYYDPENPAEAILDRTAPSGVEYNVIGVILLVAAVLVILYPARGGTN